MSDKPFIVQLCNCEQCRSGSLIIRSRLDPRWTVNRTPWAVRCLAGCSTSRFTLIHLMHHEYARQMSDPNAKWECPKCNGPAEFSDKEYEAWQTYKYPTEETRNEWWSKETG